LIEKRRTLLFCVSLALLSFLPFVSLLNSGFVHWDDDVYVTENARVQEGLTPGNVAWAFSTTYFGFYYPVTWLSHMLDCAVFGLNAGGHHLTSMLIHLVNSVVLFMFFRRATSEEAKSFIMSAVFAIHPLNVESVAWISERKNLLSGFFFLLGMYLYLNYVKSPTASNFAKVFACYLLGLMSKPTLVTFAPALLLLDVWPLGRVGFSRAAAPGNRKALLEKALLLIPVPLFSYLTITAQKEAGALGSLGNFPLSDRLAGAVLALGRYIVQFFAPLKLTAMYPHLRNDYSVPLLLLSLVSVAALTLFFSALFAKNKLYLVGWLWFLGNLVPTLGIIQVGGQASADRYMYIPMIGLLIISVFGAGTLVLKLPKASKIPALTLLSLFPIFFTVKSVSQASTWKNSETLFSNMTKVSPRASQGHYNMGLIWKQKGDCARAIECYKKALECDPSKAEAYNNMGNCYAQAGDWANAVESFRKACGLSPGSVLMRYNLAMALELSGETDAAIAGYSEILKEDPAHLDARKSLIALLAAKGETENASRLASEGAHLFPREPFFSTVGGQISNPAGNR